MTWCARAGAARALEAMNTQAFRQGRDALVSVLVFLLAGAALAEGTYLQFLQTLANAESSNQPGIVNKYGYVGLFQMEELALQDAGYYRGDGTRDTNDWTGGWTGRDGINSLADFQASPQAQVNAVTRYHQVIENYISANGLRKYIGTTINGVVLTESGLVAGAHLVGMGNLRAWLRSGGRVVPMDGNKVPVTSYASRFAGYGVSASPPAYWGPGGSTTPVTTPITPAPAAGSTPWLRSPGGRRKRLRGSRERLSGRHRQQHGGSACAVGISPRHAAVLLGGMEHPWQLSILDAPADRQRLDLAARCGGHGRAAADRDLAGYIE